MKITLVAQEIEVPDEVGRQMTDPTIWKGNIVNVSVWLDEWTYSAKIPLEFEES